MFGNAAILLDFVEILTEFLVSGLCVSTAEDALIQSGAGPGLKVFFFFQDVDSLVCHGYTFGGFFLAPRQTM